MRLINYEEYKNKLLEIRDSIPLTVPAATYELMREKPYAQGMAMRGGIHKALKCLEQCQNVSDVAPVRHGRWIGCNGEIVDWDENNPGCPKHSCFCNICKSWLTASDEFPVIAYFCPNCGAKMDGGADND